MPKRSSGRHQSCALYRAYDRRGRLLYVGKSLGPAARFRGHSQTQPWWHEVDTIRLEHFPDDKLASEAEKAAIQAEKPRYNIVHAVGDRHRAVIWEPPACCCGAHHELPPDPRDPNRDEYYTACEVARIWRCTEEYVHWLISTKQIKTHFVRRRWLIHHSQLRDELREPPADVPDHILGNRTVAKLSAAVATAFTTPVAEAPVNRLLAHLAGSEDHRLDA